MMNSLDYLKKTRQNGKRYFTLEQFMLDRKLSQNAALNAIHRLKTHGDLISPVRGLYVIVPPENQSQGYSCRRFATYSYELFKSRLLCFAAFSSTVPWSCSSKGRMFSIYFKQTYQTSVRIWSN